MWCQYLFMNPYIFWPRQPQQRPHQLQRSLFLVKPLNIPTIFLIFYPGWPQKEVTWYVLITFFHESLILNVFFSRTITVILAFNNLFWFLNENSFRRDQNKRQISLKKFRIQANMWWTHYRSLTQRYLTQIPLLFPLPETETPWIHRKII